MRHRLTGRLPLAAGVAALVYALAPLAKPASMLAVRDLPVFHLPLRIAFAAAVRDGLPAWNPWLHGGQPILSNPNYAALYPPSWLVLLLPPSTAVHLILALHAALGFAGAWKLARHLGCDPAPAAFAAIAFAAGGTSLGIASWVPGYTGYAWLPWIVFAADRLFAAAAPRLGKVAPLALLLAAQLAAGEPIAVMISIAAVLCMALHRLPGTARRLTLLAVAGGLALALAGAQLLPTLALLEDSARADGITSSDATLWSTAPVRLVEWVAPRLFGDPLSDDGRRYFGWRIHDRDFPYLISIYLGIPVLVLALSALLRGPIPRRAAFAAMAATGIFVALGRHNPLYAAAAEALPALRIFRYPEKFLLLTAFAAAFAAALGWQALLIRRRRGERGAADFPTAIAVVVAALASLPPLLLAARPALGRWFVRSSSPLLWTEEQLAAALAFLRQEAWLAATVAAATAVLLLAHRFARPREPVLALALVALLAADLGRHGRALLPTVPFATVLAEGTVARRLALEADRIWVDRSKTGTAAIGLATARPGPTTLWNAVDRLDPYVGILWGLSYALHPDTDLMLTGAARRALGLLERSDPSPELRRRLLGAWSVSHVVRPVPLEAALRARWLGRDDPLATVEPLVEHLPRLRFVPRVLFHSSEEAAATAALDDALSPARREHWIAPGRAGESGRSAVDTRTEEMTDRSRRLSVAYRASAPTYLVAATTYHPGWRARVGGQTVPIYATALGQLGVELPPGEHRLELLFWDRWATAGAALSGGALLLLAGDQVRRRRRRSGSPTG